MDSKLKKLGDVTIERVTAKGKKPTTLDEDSETDFSVSEEDEDNEAEEDDDFLMEDDLTDFEDMDDAEILERIKQAKNRAKKIHGKRKLDEDSDDDTRKKTKPNVTNVDKTKVDTESDYETSDDDDDDDDDDVVKDDPAKPIPIDKTDFLEKLTQGLAEPVDVLEKDGDNSEYEFDITEKLREMGEISVQAVKKPEVKEEEPEEHDVTVTSAKKSDEEEEGDDKDKAALVAKYGSGSLRKNIRDVMDDTQLDEATLAAQRQEVERLRRVQEQQRIIREVQRQLALNRQSQRDQKDAASVSITPSVSSSSYAPYVQPTTPESAVVVKLPNGETRPMPRPRLGRPPLSQSQFEMGRLQRSLNFQRYQQSRLQHAQRMAQRGHHLTPSVSIAPVAKKPIDDKPKRDVVTISSSEDDDVIVLSEDDEPPEPEEDPTNSGMHTNDAYNVPDDQGRVLINVGHPVDEADIFLAPQIARVIKPHQIGGVRFLYDNVIESVQRFETSTGFGCILAHSMGLGKTLQIVCFSDIFLRHTPARTILCIMPINTLQNWMAEYNMWLPTDASVSPLKEQGEVRTRNFQIFLLNDSVKTLAARAKIVTEWRTQGGVLLMGYELYRLLSLKGNPSKKRRKKAGQMDVAGKNPEQDETNKSLYEEIHEAIARPGPDLVICDEGHRIKNSHASISQALKQIRSKRRVVLTGYPLQNNLMEYWCMVDFVRPNYLGSKNEFSNMFERPIQNGQCIDSTPQDIRLMRYRAHVLHSLLEGFVQRRSHAVLQLTLPHKEEYVILVRMTAFQRKLYDMFMNEVVRKKAVPNPLKAFAVCCKIWNHPDVLYYFLKKRDESDAVDIDLEEVASATSANVNAEIKPPARKRAPYKPRKSKAASKLTHSEPATDERHAPTHTDISHPPSVASVTSDYFSQNSNQSSISTGHPTTLDTHPPFTDTQSSYYNYYHQNFGAYDDADGKIDLKCDEKINYDAMGPPPPIEKDAKHEVDVKKTDDDDEDVIVKDDNKTVKEDAGIPYDWATELLKTYTPGIVENSAKMEILFSIIRESQTMGDRILLFSQSLFTLNLIEDLLHNSKVPGRDERWMKNVNYYRLDGSTPAMERERLINEFNSNASIYLFMVSTRAGSLGINLVGANRVVVFDASWNPCHDTQAVCRVYRYGQKKPCFVYRLVMDNCLEKKIYDRQISKQGMADRVVDECNPDAHLTTKDVTSLCYDDGVDGEVKDYSYCKAKYIDVIMQKVLDDHSHLLSREPFKHESLLVDRKEMKLSMAEKRMAKRSYEMEKRAANSGQKGSAYQFMMRGGAMMHNKPIASVRPMQSEMMRDGAVRRSRWIPAEVWQRQGMTAQEMTLPLDVVIPTNSGDRGNMVLKAGQKVLVLKSPKGIYMQLECGKIVAIRTTMKGRSSVPVGAASNPGSSPHKGDENSSDGSMFRKDASIPMPLKGNSSVTITPKLNPHKSSSIKPFGQTSTATHPYGKMNPKMIPPRMRSAAAAAATTTTQHRQMFPASRVTGKARPFNFKDTDDVITETHVIASSDDEDIDKPSMPTKTVDDDSSDDASSDMDDSKSAGLDDAKNDSCTSDKTDCGDAKLSDNLDRSNNSNMDKSNSSIKSETNDDDRTETENGHDSAEIRAFNDETTSHVSSKNPNETIEHATNDSSVRNDEKIDNHPTPSQASSVTEMNNRENPIKPTTNNPANAPVASQPVNSMNPTQTPSVQYPNPQPYGYGNPQQTNSYGPAPPQGPYGPPQAPFNHHANPHGAYSHPPPGHHLNASAGSQQGYGHETNSHPLNPNNGQHLTGGSQGGNPRGNPYPGVGATMGQAPAGGHSMGNPVGPLTGHPVGPSTGHSVGPSTGHPVGPSTGHPVGPSTGHPVGPSTGHPVAPSTGHPTTPQNAPPYPPSGHHPPNYSNNYPSTYNPHYNYNPPIAATNQPNNSNYSPYPPSPHATIVPNKPYNNPNATQPPYNSSTNYAPYPNYATYDANRKYEQPERTIDYQHYPTSSSSSTSVSPRAPPQISPKTSPVNSPAFHEARVERVSPIKKPTLQILEVKSLDKSELISVDRKVFDNDNLSDDVLLPIKAEQAAGARQRATLKNYRRDKGPSPSVAKTASVNEPMSKSALAQLERATSQIGSEQAHGSLRQALDVITAEDPENEIKAETIQTKKTHTVQPFVESLETTPTPLATKPKRAPAKRRTKKVAVDESVDEATSVQPTTETYEQMDGGNVAPPVANPAHYAPYPPPPSTAPYYNYSSTYNPSNYYNYPDPGVYVKQEPIYPDADMAKPPATNPIPPANIPTYGAGPPPPPPSMMSGYTTPQAHYPQYNQPYGQYQQPYDSMAYGMHGDPAQYPSQPSHHHHQAPPHYQYGGYMPTQDAGAGQMTQYPASGPIPTPMQHYDYAYGHNSAAQTHPYGYMPPPSASSSSSSSSQPTQYHGNATNQSSSG